MRLLPILALAALVACSGGGGAPAAEGSAAAADSPAVDSSAASADSPGVVSAPLMLVMGAPLDSLDYLVDGVGVGMDSAAVRAALGAPDSVTSMENPYGGGTLPSWHYRGLEVMFADDMVHGVSINDPGRATRRGARVGDTPERIRELYGERTRGDDESWDFVDPADPSGLTMVTVSFAEGRVSAIYAGAVLD